MPDDYLVFSLKYRPQTFDEIKCQDPVRDTLKKAIANNRVAHAYLFCGPRGVGKTTTARILAKALNCEKGPTITPDGTCASCREIAASRSMDVIEIDGASNRQIDDIRDLRENIKYAPSAGRYKIYIIDEVHMLTEFAFNALLKTLEEPPRHAKFIFATTAPHKVPSTILSRCQRFDFRKASVDQLVELLRGIASREKMKVEDDALYAIARRAEGSIRDSETILDQLHAFRPEGIALDDVEQLLGVVPADTLYRFVDLLKSGTPAELLTFANDLFDRGYNLIELVSGLAAHIRALLALRLGVAKDALGFSAGDLARLEPQAAQFAPRDLSSMLDTIVAHEEALKYTMMPRVLLEVMTLKLAANQPSADPPGPAPRPHETPATPTRAPAAGRNEAVRKPKPTPAAPVSAPASQAPASDRSLWDTALTSLHQTRPLLAGVLETVAVIDFGPDAIRITRPAAPMWDEKELAAELQDVEATLSQLAGRPVKLAVAQESNPKPGSAGSKKPSAVDRVKAVYDCEEL